MQIHITNKQQDLSIDKPYLQKVVVALANGFNVHFDEMSLHFVSEKKIKELHKAFFNDPSSTDCITLPIDPPGQKPYCLLGEVFVCPKVAKAYAASHKLDEAKEVLLYVIHGFLHLIGYDDMEEEDEKIMRQMESSAFEHLIREGLCSA